MLCIHYCYRVKYHVCPPSKMLLQDLARKGPFLHPCKILQCLARSCRILWDLAGFYRNLAGILQEFLQNPARSHKIPQDLARSCKILQGCKKKGPFLARSCKSVFTGQALIQKNTQMAGLDFMLGFHMYSSSIAAEFIDRVLT